MEPVLRALAFALSPDNVIVADLREAPFVFVYCDWQSLLFTTAEWLHTVLQAIYTDEYYILWMQGQTPQTLAYV